MLKIKTKIKEKICKFCKKSFEPKNPLDTNCDIKCYYKHIDQKAKEKKAKVKEKKKVSVSSLSKVADVFWAKCVREIGKCEYCGSTDNLNAHHIFSRNNKSVRWEIANGICLDSGHHTFSSVFSPHQTPVEFTYWLEEYKGKDYLNKLQELAHIPLRVTPDFLQEKIRIFKAILEEK